MRSTLAAALALAVSALFAAGCAGSGNKLPKGPIDPESVHTLVVLPLNVVTSMPVELEEGAPQVENALRAYLEGYGKSVVRPSLGEAQSDWVASATALRDQVGPDAMSFQGAARQLALRLRARQEYDALVVPSITFRPAQLRTRRVTWDGVDRKLETVGESHTHGSMTLANTFHGQIQAPSISVFVFSPEGELLFEGVGGLDLAHRARILEGKYLADTRWNLEPLPDLFTDAPLLREGIAVAFDPFLPRRTPGE